MYWGTTIERSQTDKMLIFIRDGIDLDEPLPSGDSPLHVCAKLGHLNASQILLLYDANIHLRNELGYTAIQLAARYSGKFELLKTFIQFGADPFERNIYGKNALDYSRKYGGHEMFLSYVVLKKWRQWTFQRIKSREKQFVRFVWEKCLLSCELESISQFI